MQKRATFRGVWVLLAIAACTHTRMADPSVFRYDRGLPLDVEIAESERADGFTRVALSYRSPMEGRVAADLFVPSELSGPAPAIVFLHGLPGTKESMAPLAAAYARAGVIGLTVSAPFNRTELPYRQDFARLLPAPLFTENDRRELIQVAMDVSHAIDLLERDPRVDSRRIAFVGFSYGGGVGTLLAAIEPRFKAIALMSPTSGLATWMRSVPSSHIAKSFFLEMTEPQQKAWLSEMDSVEPWRFLASMGTKAPILLQAGTQDVNVSAADRDHITNADRSGVQVMLYESGHALQPETQRDQARFLARILGVSFDSFVPTAAPIR